MLRRTELDGEWILELTQPAEGATVTAGTRLATDGRSVHGTLQDQGIIPDPFVEQNETVIQWVGRSDWSLTRSLAIPDEPGQVTELVFEGIDTIADVSIDGARVLESRNMHLSHSIDVSGYRGGTCSLEVALLSPFAYADDVEREVGPYPGSFDETPYTYVRKMACSFGWDWGPRVADLGLWRPVHLRTWSTARLDSVVASTNRPGEPSVEVRVGIARQPGVDASLSVRARVRGTGLDVEGSAVMASDEQEVILVVKAPGAARWWPRGAGAAALYDLEVELLDGSGVPLDRDERRIGFRTIELDTTSSDGAFGLVINDEPVLARGFNWIPATLLPGLADRTAVRTLLEAAVAANSNIVRVWGGGTYESRDFYDACDELGILVWQDFAFACGAYPETAAMREDIANEARQNVTRLASHPSLVLWNGNNENLWLHEALNWENELDHRPWGAGYYFDVIPRVIASLAPDQPYYPGSPWSGGWNVEPNDPDHQTHHAWEMWNNRDYIHYRDDAPRFVSEFGWQGPASTPVLTASISDALDGPHAAGLVFHQKAADGVAKLQLGISRHFPVTEDFADWHYITSVIQARAVTAALDHWASLWPRCRGAIVWQLNDIWPAISWSALDVAGTPKPVLHAIADSFDDLHVSLIGEAGGRRVFVHNRGRSRLEADLGMRGLSSSGTTQFTTATALRLDAGASSFVDASLGAAEALEVTLLGRRRFAFADADGSAGIPDPGLETSVVVENGVASLVVTATSAIAREVLVRPELEVAGVTASSRLLTILPGEQCVVPLTVGAGVDRDDLDRVARGDRTVTSLFDYLARNR